MALEHEKADMHDVGLMVLPPVGWDDYAVVLRITTDSGSTFLVQRTAPDQYVVETDSEVLLNEYGLSDARTLRYATAWCGRSVDVGKPWTYHNFPENHGQWETSVVTSIALTLLEYNRQLPSLTELPELAHL